jgi:uncharacterized repeat protein (TIGR01451 family)
MKYLRIAAASVCLVLLAAASVMPRRANAWPSPVASQFPDPASITDRVHPTDESPKDHGGLSNNDWQSIQAAWQAGRHAITESTDQPGTWKARNPGQQWTTRFDGRGFDTQPDGAGWRWGMELRRWGLVGAEQPVSGKANVSSDGQRASYRWGNCLEEWFVNDLRGLEHGYTVHRRPNGKGEQLRFELALRGGLDPQIDADGRGVRFVDAAGAAALTYKGLKVWDARGTVLNSSFQAMAHGLTLTVDTRHARYPITIDPIAQQAYLKASNSNAGDNFGFSLAISGDTVVVGARYEASNATGVNGNQSNNSAKDSGAAYVFVRTAVGWSQQAYLKASNTGGGDAFRNGDMFSTSVAVSGDTLVVGAPWESSNASGINGDQTNDSADSAGAAYVFVRAAGVWSQQAYLKASNADAGDHFGYSVAVSGDTVIVGAVTEASTATGVNGDQSNNTSVGAGAAYVFVRAAGNWTQQAYLKASNTDSDDLFGGSVALSGDTAVVGARHESSNATGVNGEQSNNAAGSAGAAYVFARNAGSWSQQAYLKSSNSEQFDEFGGSVALSGDTVVVGAMKEGSTATGVNGDQTNNSARWSGAAYVFKRDVGTWNQQAYLKASNTNADDSFGGSVAVYGDTVVVGARLESSNALGINGDQANNAAAWAGAAYLFVRTADTWIQQAYLKASNTERFDTFGAAVAVSGDFVMVGANYEASSATGVNGDQSNNAANGAGATYLFLILRTVGGTVSGLSGSGAVLQNNFGDDLTISADGGFTFATPLESGADYSISVSVQPNNPSQTCTVSNGSGTVASANITDVQVTCVTNTYTVGGTVSGLSGTGLILRNNDGDDLPVAANGAFTFTTPVASGAVYSVTAFAQPSNLSQTCSVTNSGGTVTSANVSNVQVICATNTYTVGGTVIGLSGSGLVLRNNDGDDLSLAANGGFTFVAPVASGAAYSVTAFAQPANPSQTCTVSNGSGIVTSTNVSNVQVTCFTNTYTVGGSVTGLSGSGLMLRLNGGDDLPVNSSTFTFASPLPSGANYIVGIGQQPGNPQQICTLDNASGSVTNANITNVAVTCVDALPALSLSVDDAYLFARYGQILDYVVTLSNTGNATATDVAVGSVMSAGLDAGNAHWQCFGAGSGATCSANGTGPLIDMATLPADRSLSWLVSVPVLLTTADDAVQFDLNAPGAMSTSDVDILVLLRSGFDVSNGDGTESEPLPREGVTAGFHLPPASSNRIEDIRTFSSDSTRILVQRIRFNATDYVRLLEHVGTGLESVSPWVAAAPDALLVCASLVDAEGHQRVLLEGALQSLLLPIGPVSTN